MANPRVEGVFVQGLNIPPLPRFTNWVAHQQNSQAHIQPIVNSLRTVQQHLPTGWDNIMSQEEMIRRINNAGLGPVDAHKIIYELGFCGVHGTSTPKQQFRTAIVLTRSSRVYVKCILPPSDQTRMGVGWRFLDGINWLIGNLRIASCPDISQPNQYNGPKCADRVWLTFNWVFALRFQPSHNYLYLSTNGIAFNQALWELWKPVRTIFGLIKPPLPVKRIDLCTIICPIESAKIHSHDANLHRQNGLSELPLVHDLVLFIEVVGPDGAEDDDGNHVPPGSLFVGQEYNIPEGLTPKQECECMQAIDRKLAQDKTRLGEMNRMLKEGQHEEFQEFLMKEKTTEGHSTEMTDSLRAILKKVNQRTPSAEETRELQDQADQEDDIADMMPEEELYDFHYDALVKNTPQSQEVVQEDSSSMFKSLRSLVMRIINNHWNRAWWEACELLKEFHEENGHCCVPSYCSECPRLRGWVQEQQNNNKKGKLSQEQIDALEHLDFEWCTWSERLNQLKEYKKLHGHCRVPRGHPENPPLGRWVHNQREEYKKGHLSQERIEKLEEIGFQWVVSSKSFSEMLQELEEYKKLHGHCQVPQRCPENPQLANWVYNRREDYKKGNLSQERIEKLEAIGFQWGLVNPSFSEMLQELEEYKKLHGHCQVPQKYPENPQLANWVKHRRSEYKRGKLLQEKIEKLEAIGFEWSVKRRKPLSADDYSPKTKKLRRHKSVSFETETVSIPPQPPNVAGNVDGVEESSWFSREDRRAFKLNIRRDVAHLTALHIDGKLGNMDRQEHCPLGLENHFLSRRKRELNKKLKEQRIMYVLGQQTIQKEEGIQNPEKIQAVASVLSAPAVSKAHERAKNLHLTLKQLYVGGILVDPIFDIARCLDDVFLPVK